MSQEFSATRNILFPETDEMKPNIHERLSLETEDSHAWMFVQDWPWCSVLSVVRSYFIESCERCYSYTKSTSIVVCKYQFSLGTNWNTDWNYRNICMAHTSDHHVDMCCSAIEASGWRHKRPGEFWELLHKSGKAAACYNVSLSRRYRNALFNLFDLLVTQVFTSPGRQVAVAAKCFTASPKICGSSERNLVHVSIVARRILTWLRGFRNFCAPEISDVPRNFFRGGGVQQIQLRTEDRGQNGDLGAAAP
jgi:hypothetical protein